MYVDGHEREDVVQVECLSFFCKHNIFGLFCLCFCCKQFRKKFVNEMDETRRHAFYEMNLTKMLDEIDPISETTNQSDSETRNEGDSETRNEKEPETRNEEESETRSEAESETRNEAETETRFELDLTSSSSIPSSFCFSFVKNASITYSLLIAEHESPSDSSLIAEYESYDYSLSFVAAFLCCAAISIEFGAVPYYETADNIMDDNNI